MPGAWDLLQQQASPVMNSIVMVVYSLYLHSDNIKLPVAVISLLLYAPAKIQPNTLQKLIR